MNLKKLYLATALTGIIASTSGGAFAADDRQNPYGLVYDHAIKENVSGKVNIHPVNYALHGLKIAANVYTPAQYEPSKKYPAIVIAHPNGGVKEQVAGLMAQRLAELGYITITADAAYQGASGGEPRHTDLPSNRIEDIHGMADFISQYAGVDATRIGILGICGGGGYTLKAAQTDKRFKTVATLSMFDSGLAYRNGYMDSQLDSIQERLQQATAARAQQMAGGTILYANDLAGQINDETAAQIPVDLYRQGYEYYVKSHAHPNSTPKITLSSLLDLMNFDAASNMDLIHQPLLMIAGSKADSLYMTERAFKAASGTSDKELFKIDGATHIETYFVPKYVEQIVDKLKLFYGKTL